MNPASKADSPIRLSAGVIVIVLLVIFGLWTVDAFLAKMERTELQAEANRFYQEGTKLLNDGRSAEAVETLRRAFILARRNRQYQLQLATALTAEGKGAEAESLLNDVLQVDSNDGEANLLTARLMARKGNIPAAQSYYHRAIYGSWRDNAARHETQARLELVNLLASRNDSRATLAELLALEAQAQGDPPMEKQIARLYLTAGSPARSAAAYRALLRNNPKDGDSYEGLGDAELSLGNYRQAQAAFLSALRRSPGDSIARKRLELASSMAALDPTPRHLSSQEKYARSIRILELARNAAVACGQDDELVAAAKTALTAKARPNFTNELAEQELTLAGKLWKARPVSCAHDALDSDEPLRLIMEKLAQ